jgi:glycosyltransferase involved in cell wall biosynthesis
VGRITFQKGPAYFVHAAELVLKSNPRVRFRVVGTGDLLDSMKQLVWELGIDKSFVFDGFLDARQVQEVLADSDVFVMPSVSEPFGIVALEAVQQNIPVIISKQSGVSEVLPNALKVDFWDTELLADRILSLLKYHKVRRELVSNSQRDLVRRTWHQAALKCQEAYNRAKGQRA